MRDESGNFLAQLPSVVEGIDRPIPIYIRGTARNISVSCTNVAYAAIYRETITSSGTASCRRPITFPLFLLFRQLEK